MRQSIKQLDRKNQKGFTLIELLVAMGLSLLVLGAVASVFRVQTHTVKAQEYKMEAQEYARNALDMMGREMRNLGYFPTRIPCDATGGIIAASAVTIQFEYDADGLNGCADIRENIIYNFTGNIATNTPGDITRRDMNDANGTQFLTSGTSNVTGFQFIYYPAQVGSTSPPPYCYNVAGDLTVNGVSCSGVVTANLGNIKRVSVSLTVKSRSSDAQFGGTQTIVMNSNLDLRNRCRATPPNC